MKRIPLLFLLTSIGCTTTPQAGLMDRLFPNRNACPSGVCGSPVMTSVAPAEVMNVPPPPSVVASAPMTPAPAQAVPAAPIQALPAPAPNAGTVLAPEAAAAPATVVQPPTVLAPQPDQRRGHPWFRWLRPRNRR